MRMSGLNVEKGSITTELVMVMPLLAAAMLFLMGLGYSLMTKQNAIVAARAAVYYRATLEEPPSATDVNEMIKDAVSPGRETWFLDFNEENIPNPDTGNAGAIQNAVSGLYQGLNKEIRYTAYGTATLGYLPRIMELGNAESTYYLPHRTWTCEQTGGSYGRIAMNGLSIPSTVSGWLDTSCCDCYQGTR